MPQKAQQIKIYIYLRPSHSTEIHQYLMSMVPIARTNNHALMHQRHAPCIFISYYFVHSDLIIIYLVSSPPIAFVLVYTPLLA